MQNLQPVGTVNWGDVDPWLEMEDINESADRTFIVSVVYGDDRIVREDENGDWVFVGELQQDEEMFYEEVDDFAEQRSDYIVIDAPNLDQRYLFRDDG